MKASGDFDIFFYVCHQAAQNVNYSQDVDIEQKPDVVVDKTSIVNSLANDLFVNMDKSFTILNIFRPLI